MVGEHSLDVVFALFFQLVGFVARVFEELGELVVFGFAGRLDFVGATHGAARVPRYVVRDSFGGGHAQRGLVDDARAGLTRLVMLARWR